MAKYSSLWLGATALSALLLTASDAAAELEATGVGLAAQQVVSTACNLNNIDAASEACVKTVMRWRLCEQGFATEGLSRDGLYKCFID